MSCFDNTLIGTQLDPAFHYYGIGHIGILYGLLQRCTNRNIKPGYVDKKHCAIKKQSQVSNGEGSSPRHLIKSNSPRSLNTDYESKKRDHIEVIL